MQQKLFFDNENDALRAAIISAGGFKHVAHKLWPAKKEETAYARLVACMAEDKHEKLEFAEMIAIAKMARDKGCHQFMQYLGDELAYQCTPLDPQDEQAVLFRKFISAKDEIAEIAERIERNQQRMAVVR